MIFPSPIFYLWTLINTQSIRFQDYKIKYGEKYVIKFEILDSYPGNKYQNAAISELEFSGKYSGNIH